MTDGLVADGWKLEGIADGRWQRRWQMAVREREVWWQVNFA